MTSSPLSARKLLPRQEFLEVVKRAPLVSIDLIVRDGAGRVLLGRRSNAPARGWWFVPGDSIRKNETLDTVYCHIARAELGLELRRADARFLGVYEHFYPDHAGGTDFGTHYVVLAHALELERPPTPPAEQHSAYCWMDPAGLLGSAEVHDYTKAYFR
jgi:colanic acid biosynthesis protein WcaH